MRSTSCWRFARGDGSLTASDLWRHVDLSRPRLYRLLRTLEQRGFIAATGGLRRYRLGPSVGHLAQGWGQGQDLAGLVEPVMQQLRDKTGETVTLLLHRGQERVNVGGLPSARPDCRRWHGYGTSAMRSAATN